MQASVPQMPGPATQISAAGNASLAVTADGQLVCWGFFFNCPQPSDLNNQPVQWASLNANLSGMVMLAAPPGSGSQTVVTW